MQWISEEVTKRLSCLSTAIPVNLPRCTCNFFPSVILSENARIVPDKENKEEGSCENIVHPKNLISFATHSTDKPSGEIFQSFCFRWSLVTKICFLDVIHIPVTLPMGATTLVNSGSWTMDKGPGARNTHKWSSVSTAISVLRPLISCGSSFV
eukprot:TRINITY_DN4912_c0_g1_i2.p1 TRINITY_DN4912_c0_g1~~TRINITY_DN4912_c0_g1_i2.p1  ORF type:complete len:153 (+),score=25.46 TRINITY_DN4912_c0_g1_i2:923-1381(+)